MKVKVKLLSHVQFFAIPWTVAYWAPLSMEFQRQQYWSGLPFPSPGDLPNPGLKPGSPALQTDVLPSEPYQPLCQTQYQNRSTQFLVLDMEGSFKSWSQRSKLVHILSTGQDVGHIYNGILVIKNNEIMQVNNGPRYFHIV